MCNAGWIDMCDGITFGETAMDSLIVSDNQK